MRNCAEAVYQLRQCGHKGRDRDGDGIPCERLCGKTRSAMERRLAAQGYRAGAARPLLRATGRKRYSCSPRKTCGRMASCEEARFHLKQCGNKRLDGDGDGVPCNSLCR